MSEAITAEEVVAELAKIEANQAARESLIDEYWDELTPTERMPVSFDAETERPCPLTLRSGENPARSEEWMPDWLFIEGA